MTDDGYEQYLQQVAEDRADEQAYLAAKEAEYLANLQAEQVPVECDCKEDAAKPYGGHKKDCPNAIPF